MPILYINPARRRRRTVTDADRARRARRSARIEAGTFRRRPTNELDGLERYYMSRARPVSLRGKKNPARKRRAKPVRRRGGRKPLYGAAAIAWRKKHSVKKKRTTSKAATRRRRKDKGMPRKKLYGAALAAYNKKRGRGKVKRRRKARRVKSSVAAHMRAANQAGAGIGAKVARSTKKRRRRKSAAARKAAATRARKKAARSRAAKKAARTRRRRAGRAAAPRRRKARRRRSRGSAAPKRRRRRRRSAAKAAPRRRRRRKASGRRRSSGRRRRRARRFRPTNLFRVRRRRGRRVRSRLYVRNPSGGLVSQVIATAKAAVPVALSLYLTRVIVNKFGPSIPLVDRAGVAAKPLIATMAVVGAHFATKRGPLVRYRNQILLGTGINLVDTLISAFAPPDVKAMFGLGDSGMYDSSLGEYIQTGEYIDESGRSAVGEYVDEQGSLSLGDIDPEQLLDDVAAGSPLHSHQAGEDANYTGVFRGGFGGTLG